jgi:hypothetical protein
MVLSQKPLSCVLAIVLLGCLQSAPGAVFEVVRRGASGTDDGLASGWISSRRGYRVKWTDRDITTLWLGRKEAGSGDGEFDDPSGLAILAGTSKSQEQNGVARA